MKDEDVETMMDRLGRKLGPGEFVVALVFAGRVKRHFGKNRLTVRLWLVERRAQDLIVSDWSDPERMCRARMADSVASAAREYQSAIAQTVGDCAQELLRAYCEVREIRSPLRDKRTGKEGAE